MFLLQVHSHVENWLEVTNSHQFDAKYPNLISSSAQERERSRRWMSVEEAFLVAKQMRESRPEIHDVLEAAVDVLDKKLTRQDTGG